MQPPKKITLKDVAKKAGVAVSTASCALRGMPNVTKKTRLHVQKVADKLGFTSNRMAASLASHRFSASHRSNTPQIAIITHLCNKAQLTSSLYVSPLTQSSKKLGYLPTHIDLATYPSSLPELLSHLHHRGVEGIVFERLETMECPLSEITPLLANFSIVACGGTGKYILPIDRVQTDVFRSVTLAWQKAYQKGYRRIGVVLHKHREYMAADDDFRRLGAVTAMQQAFPDVTPVPPLFEDIHDLENFKQWYRSQRPDCVLCFSNHISRTFSDLSLTAPQDCGWVVFNSVGDQFFRYANSHIIHVSSCCINTEKIAQTSITLLDQKIRLGIRGIPYDPAFTIIAPTWFEGESIPGPTLGASYS